jgi:enamine deaminase RidA (YjgF/YER057c/UK114 family)
MSHTREKIAALGIELPAPTTPMGNYIPSLRIGNLIYLSGVVARDASDALLAGKLGADYTVEQGYQAAKSCALQILANVEREAGDLDRVVRIVKLSGMVNATPDFTEPPAVVNGCSDTLVEILGDRGRHTRSAFGVASLPGGVSVEVEAVVEIRA